MRSAVHAIISLSLSPPCPRSRTDVVPGRRTMSSSKKSGAGLQQSLLRPGSVQQPATIHAPTMDRGGGGGGTRAPSACTASTVSSCPPSFLLAGSMTAQGHRLGGGVFSDSGGEVGHAEDSPCYTILREHGARLLYMARTGHGAAGAEISDSNAVPSHRSAAHESTARG